MSKQVKVLLIGAKGTRTTEVTPRPFSTRHIKIGTPNPTPLPAITPELTPASVPVEPQPKMTTEQHHNDRFLNKIKASLSLLGGWNTAEQVFSRYHNKYKISNVVDIEIGLGLLVDAGKVEMKSEKSERKLYRVKAKPVPEGEELGKKLRGLDKRRGCASHSQRIAGQASLMLIQKPTRRVYPVCPP